MAWTLSPWRAIQNYQEARRRREEEREQYEQEIGLTVKPAQPKPPKQGGRFADTLSNPPQKK